MNIYLVGMVVTMIIYVVVGALISRGVKNANDFYVAGRNAPAYLITGSLVASFIGVGLFMGDVGEAYSGFFGPIMVAVGVLSVGYIFGSVFFGRYLRRSQALTIPQYFEKRFDSKAMRILATITGSFIMLVYSLSCVQGIATLMSVVTGLTYNACIILAVIAFTLITAFSGAKGVLITDTIMFAVFSVATIVGAGFVATRAGGWMSTVTEMATYQPIPGILAAGGNPSYFYPTTHENMIWACGYGVAWMAVLAVAPWQSSRYLMANDIKDVCPDILPNEIAIIEYPNLDDNTIPSGLLNIGTVNLMITRANRTWKDVDQKALTELQSRLENKDSLYMYLTEAQRYAVEEFVGQLPPYTKFNNFVYRLSQLGLTATEKESLYSFFSFFLHYIYWLLEDLLYMRQYA